MMRSTILLVTLLEAIVVNAAAPTCAPDNCLRAVIASSAKPGSASARADCSSFFMATVTPATMTSFSTVTATAAPTTSTIVQTSTDTVTLTATVQGGQNADSKRSAAAKQDHRLNDEPLVARQETVAPSRVPTYASACSGTVRYASACSCIGVSRTTTTAAAPTTTVTVTNTVTPTTFVTSATTVTTTITTTTTAAPTSCANGQFSLQAQGGGVSGQYIKLGSGSNLGVDQGSFTPNRNEAAVFTFSGTLLIYAGLEANADNTALAKVFFSSPGSFTGAGRLVCSASPSNGLSCTVFQSNSIFQLCPDSCATGQEPCGGLSIGTVVDARCVVVSFNLVCG